MTKVAMLQEAEAWWKKLNDPSTASYRLTHAYACRDVESNSLSSSFNPNAVLEQFQATSDERMKRLVEATKR